MRLNNRTRKVLIILLSWIPTAGLIIIAASFIKHLADIWGQLTTPSIIDWEYVWITILMVILPWIAGHMVGRIKSNLEGLINADHTEATEDN